MFRTKCWRWRRIAGGLGGYQQLLRAAGVVGDQHLAHLADGWVLRHLLGELARLSFEFIALPAIDR